MVTGEMSPVEAAMVAELLGVKFAVASHYYDPDHADVKEFLAEVPRHDTTGKHMPLAMRPDEVLVIDGEEWRIERPLGAATLATSSRLRAGPGGSPRWRGRWPAPWRPGNRHRHRPRWRR